MPTPHDQKISCGVGGRQDAYPTKSGKILWGGGQAGCLPHKIRKNIVGWGAGRMPTPQNQKISCGVGGRQDAYPTKSENILWGRGQAGCLPHKIRKHLVG
ncbi:hypothetical protein [Microseira wollei]|uniref:hypothetical protein n=1 Tax=Microseira wollei TaxID=467598 RepID=UPI001CFD3586|nr:hypothetical protein [Microseira wollei]